MTDMARNEYIPNYTTDGSLEKDMDTFEYPTEVVSKEEKIEYLMTTSYRLENNIEIKLQRNGINSYFGIGGTERPFKGFFNGNGKKISLSGTVLNPNIVGPNNIGGVFGNIEGGTIANLDVEVEENIKFSQLVALTNFGIVAGNITNTKLYNINVYMKATKIQLLFDDMQYKAPINIGGIVANAVNNNKIEKCSLNMNNNAQIVITDNIDTDNLDFNIGGIISCSDVDSNSRITISDCNVNLENSIISVTTPRNGLCAGIIADAKKTSILRTKVNMQNSQIGVSSAGETRNK